MQEKEMVLDVLSGVKASIANYAKVITECANTGLRQAFQKMRDGDEKFQLDLYQAASQKGYYHPAPGANPQDTSAIKTYLSQSFA